MSENTILFTIVSVGAIVFFAVMVAMGPPMPTAPATERREPCDELNTSFTRTDTLAQDHLDSLWSPKKSEAIGNYELYLMERDDTIAIAENCLADLRAAKSPKAKLMAKALETMKKEQTKARQNQIRHLKAWKLMHEK